MTYLTERESRRNVLWVQHHQEEESGIERQVSWGEGERGEVEVGATMVSTTHHTYTNTQLQALHNDPKLQHAIGYWVLLLRSSQFDSTVFSFLSPFLFSPSPFPPSPPPLPPPSSPSPPLTIVSKDIISDSLALQS